MKNRKMKKKTVGLSLRKKQLLVLGCAAVLLCGAAGATLAWLTRDTDPVVNTFTVADVSTEVEEEFDGQCKTVNAKNTGDIPVYIRIKLISYRVDENRKRIGGEAAVDFIPGEGWVEHGGYYYYTSPVNPGGKPADNLMSNYELKSYDSVDADGGKQVIEVMAEAIQSEPAETVGEAWGVTISNDEVTDYEPNSSGQ